MTLQHIQNPEGTVVAVGVPINTQAVLIQSGSSVPVGPLPQKGDGGNNV